MTAIDTSIKPDALVDIHQPGPVVHWAPGYRFVHYETGRRTCIVARTAGVFAGVESRWNVEDVRPAVATTERIELRARIDGRMWATHVGYRHMPPERTVQGNFAVSRDHGYLGDVARNPNAFNIYSRAFCFTAERG